MKSTELIVVVFYTIIVLGVGVYLARRATKSLDDYLICGRVVGPWIMGFILFASLNSAGFMIGNIGFVYKFGVTLMWGAAFGCLVGGILAIFFFARPYLRTRSRTVPDIIKYLYQSKGITVFSAVVLFVAIFAYCIAQYKAGGLLINYVLGIGYVKALAIATVIFIIYTTAGGMWAVTFTDLVQGVWMYVIAILLPLIAMVAFGGPFDLLSKAMSIKPVLGGIFKVPISSYVGLFLTWVGCLCVIPHVIMHALSAKDIASARWGFVIQNILYATSILLAWLFIAGAAIILDPKMAAPDEAIFLVVEKLVNPFFGGLVVAGLLAGLMSTTDSMILVLASAISYDIYGNLKSDATESQLVKLSAIFVVIIGAITFFAAIRPPKFLTALFMDAAGSIAACLFPVIALGIWWKRSNASGAIVSMVVGFFVYWIVALFKLLPPWCIITYTYILVTVLFVIVSLVTKPPSAEMTERIANLHA